MLYAGQVAEIRSTRVRSIPLEPAITIDGNVVVAAGRAGSAAECVVADFRDDATG